MKQRPAWISVISVFFMALSGLSILGLIFVWVRHPSAWRERFGITGLILTLVIALIGWGLWELRNWARTALILLTFLSVLEEIGRRLTSGHPVISEIVFQIAILGLLL